MFYTYIIYSSQIDEYYIGHTGNLEDRLFRHRNSGSKATKKAKDWELKFVREFEQKSEAARFELLIKSKKSRTFIIRLIQGSELV